MESPPQEEEKEFIDSDDLENTYEVEEQMIANKLKPLIREMINKGK